MNIGKITCSFCLQWIYMKQWDKHLNICNRAIMESSENPKWWFYCFADLHNKVYKCVLWLFIILSGHY